MFIPRTPCLRLFSAILLTLLGGLALPARSAGPNGLYATFLNSDGSVAFTSSLASQFSAAEAGWIRAEAILPSGHTTWDAYSLGQLDQAVNNAGAAGLQIIMLLNKQSITGPVSTAPWNDNNHENAGGNGQNSFQTDWVNNVVLPLVQHFHDRIKVYEIWNEPADTSSAIYFDPSTYSWLLTKSWIAVHSTLGYGDVTVISGDGNSGAWLTSVYQQGTNSAVNSFASAKATYGTYPVDGFAQHMYIDGWEEAPSADISAWIGTYHSDYAAYEGSNTTKGTYITEFGWDSKYLASRGVSNPDQVQADDLGRSYTVFNAGAVGAYVKCGIWFNWKNNTVGDFGLLDSSGNQKLDYAPFQRHNTYEGKNADGSTNNNILNYYNAHGKQAVFGNPYDHGGGAYVHSVNQANAQDFYGGSHQRLLIFDAPAGVFELNDLNGLCSFYQTNGGSGRFGPPQNQEFSTASGTRQDFTMASLIFNSTSGIGAQYEAEALAVAAHTSADTVRVMIDSGMSDGEGSILDGQAVNDFVTYTVHVPAPGSYSIIAAVKKHPDRGIFQLAVASSLTGNYVNHGATQDLYASTSQYVALTVDPNANFSSSGDKAFRFTVTGKNAASTGYSLSFDYIQVLPN